MQQLQNLEIFEIEVLDLLNSNKLLDSLYFGGGTMLRLCHNLNRYSTDLDFWLDNSVNSSNYHKKVKKTLSAVYSLNDFANKKFTILFELKSKLKNRNKERENFF